MSVRARGRHRRHVHRRDADRRGDRRGRDREGADDAGRPVRGVHAGGRARARGRRRRRRRRSASSSTRRPSRRTRSSRARSRAAASSRPTASATCSRSRARCGRRSTTRSSRSRRRSSRATARSASPSGSARPARCCVPLDDDSVRAAAAILRREEVESVAVCLLHAYVNPEHEQRVGAILAEELPGRARLALGRGRARVPRVPARVDDRDQRRRSGRSSSATSSGSRAGSPTPGVEAKLLVMQSSGGVFSSEAARTRPVFMVESGPAAGRDRLGATSARRSAARRPLLRHGRHDREGRPDPGRAAVGDEGLQRRRPRAARGSAACRSPATRCGRRSSTSSRSAPAAARSPGSTRAACCASARRARAPIRGRSATGAAAPSRP